MLSSHVRSSKPRAKIFVVSAPSGAGKTTLCKKLLEDDLGLADSISMTTRPPRPGEKDGVDYKFVTRAQFLKIARSKGFLEHENNFGFLYGTPRKFVDEKLANGISVLLSIDVKGAMKVRRLYRKRAVLIFILPPSMAALAKRLKGRMADSRESIKTRLAIAKKEMACKTAYDYRIINDKIDKAYRKLKNIVTSELERGSISCKT
ncbi:MAG: guanylate kinase [Candidatus Omnitrophica bacterium]|nr:guanylate kinase [Candidatus Omnitrophota bacterium]